MKKSIIFSAALMAGLFLGVSAQAQTIVYQDNFGAGTQNSGYTLGSTPDTVDLSGSTYAVGPNYASNQILGYYAGNTSVTPGVVNNGGVYAYLPTNAAGGPALTGLTNFTLSAVMSPGAESTYDTLSLFNGALPGPSNGYNGEADYSSLGSMQFGNSGDSKYISAVGNNYFNDVYGTPSTTSPTLVGITFNATTDLLTYSYGGTLSAGGTIVGGTVLGTESVTAAQIAGINGVAFGFSDYSYYNGPYVDPTATAQQFTLSVAPVPEPSTWALMLGGVSALVVISRRRILKA